MRNGIDLGPTCLQVEFAALAEAGSGIGKPFETQIFGDLKKT